MKNWPEVEVVNTTEEFKWRLVLENEYSEWSGHYAGILTHKFKGGRIFGLVTNYFCPNNAWNEMEAFQIIKEGD